MAHPCYVKVGFVTDCILFGSSIRGIVTSTWCPFQWVLLESFTKRLFTLQFCLCRTYRLRVMQDWLYRGGWCYNCWGFEKEFWGYRSWHSSSCWLSFEHSSTDGYKVAVRRNVGFLVVGRGEVFLKCSKRVLWRSFCSPPLFQCQSSLLTFLLVSWSESWRYLAYIYWGGLGVVWRPCRAIVGLDVSHVSSGSFI